MSYHIIELYVVVPGFILSKRKGKVSYIPSENLESIQNMDTEQRRALIKSEPIFLKRRRDYHLPMWLEYLKILCLVKLHIIHCMMVSLSRIVQYFALRYVRRFMIHSINIHRRLSLKLPWPIS